MTSIQRRLGTSLAIGTVCLWMLATLITGLVIRHELDEAFDSALQETAQRLLSVAAIDISVIEFDEHEDDEDDRPSRRSIRLGEHDELLTYVVRDSNGHVILISHDADLGDFADGPFDGFRTGSAYRLFGESTTDDRVSIVIAEPLAHRNKAVLEAMLGFASPLLLLVPLSLGLVWLIIRHSMGSVKKVQLQIESRGGVNLVPIAVDDMPRELIPIAGSVNDLLKRISVALESERNFATNSAHELRTPIAGALAQTQRLITSLPEGNNKNRALQIEKTLNGISRLSEKLMQLARAESGFLVTDCKQNAYQTVLHIVDEYSRTDRSSGRIRFHCVGAKQFLVRLDQDGLAILLRNLIENALKHSPSETPVDITLSATGNALHIVNECAVITPAELECIKTRFTRGATTAPGAGLGLAIVEAITNRSGINIELKSPATDQGSGFESIVRCSQLA
ncbi:MAG: ATP-binding protein [Granulosicoccus sp.]